MASSITSVLLGLVAARPAGAQTVATGTLEGIATDDFADERSSVEYSLKSDGGDISLLPTTFSNATPGASVVVNGVRWDGYLVGRVAGSESANREGPTAVDGGQTVAVVLLRYEAEGEEEPPSAEFMREHVFTDPRSTAGFYDLETAGQITLTGVESSDGDVFGPYTILSHPGTSGYCEFGTWAEEASEAAQGAGVNLAPYDHVIFVIPGSPCRTNVAGFAELGGRQIGIFTWPLVTTEGKESLARTVAHELGHNFGLSHSHSLRCSDGEGYLVAFSDNCEVSEYGDSYDIMGDGTAFHDWYLNELGALREGNVIAADESGTYTISSSVRGSSSATLIRVPRRWTPTDEPTEWDDIEYRDMANPFESDPYAYRGVIIHNSPEGLGSSMLYYAGPAHVLSSGEWYLEPDHRFVDGSLEIETQSAAEGQATVHISLPPLFDRQPPTSPGVLTARWGESGVDLSWETSHDNGEVARYVIDRDGEEIATSADQAFLDEGATALEPGPHTYAVYAEDAANNKSEPSTAIVFVPERGFPPGGASQAPSGEQPTAGGGQRSVTVTRSAVGRADMSPLHVRIGFRPLGHRKVKVVVRVLGKAQTRRLKLWIGGVLRVSRDRRRLAYIWRRPSGQGAIRVVARVVGSSGRSVTAVRFLPEH